MNLFSPLTLFVFKSVESVDSWLLHCATGQSRGGKSTAFLSKLVILTMVVEASSRLKLETNNK